MAPADPELPEGAVSRREFLGRIAVAGLAAAAVGGAGFWLNDRQPEAAAKAITLPDFSMPPVPDRPRIAAARIESVEKTLSLCLERLGGIQRFIQPGDEVIIKPNAGFASPPSVGATTNPEVVAATIRICRRAGATIVWVVDNSINTPERCMEISGIGRAASSAGARVLIPGPSDFIDAEQPKNQFLKKWPFAFKPLLRAKKIIGIPATKQHALAGVTLSMKNWYGLLGGPRMQLHQDIHASIADLATFITPTLVILDATRILFRNGPTGGSASDVRQEGILAVATDQVALDTYGASLLGRKPEELPCLAEAERRGLGTTDLKAAGFELIGGDSVGGGE